METPVVEAPVQEKKNTGAIIGAVAAIVLCGLTGLCLLCPLSIAIFAGAQQELDMRFPNWVGIIPLCLSILGIVIGVVVPIVLLRKKKEPAAEVLPPNEPLPPAA